MRFHIRHRLISAAFFVALLVMSSSVFAAGINTDATSTSSGGDTKHDQWSHTVTSSGSDRILIVAVSYLGGTDYNVATLTYNHQNLTKAGEVDQESNVGTEIWYLVNPSTGTHAVRVSMDEKTKIKCGAVSFLNVDQTTPLGSFFSATGKSTSSSVNVTGVNEGELVFDSAGFKAAPSATVGSGQTEQWNTAYSSDIKSVASTEPSPVGGGTVTMSWGLSANIEWAIGAVAIKPAYATAVDLLSFTATGQDESVQVGWETAHEINNMGFYLYRSESRSGPFIKLTERLIPGAEFSSMGKQYEYVDSDVIRDQLYYYRLEDVDTHGQRAFHGPICVDWDADGMPDDWELAHGLDPAVDDAWLDADSDGLLNIEEYERGADPHNPDSDGDGILDGDEYFQYRRPDTGGSLSLSRGVHILNSDETGVTVELRTENFEAKTVHAGGSEFDRLRINEYVHGYIAEVGKPQLPLKGIMLDIPEGQSAHVTVTDTVSTIGYGYQVYPVPDNLADEKQAAVQVTELFAINEAAYAENAFYPAAVAQLGAAYIFRNQPKQQLIFYPLSFNPVSGQIRHYTRIRVRVDYVDAALAKAQNTLAQPWSPSSKNNILDNLNPAGATAMAFIAPAFLNSPIISAIASLGMLTQAVWVPPGYEWFSEEPAYKILIDPAGLYRLTGDYLAANGVNLTGVNINQVRLYNLGQEVALYVVDDDGDNQFDADDYIEFYAAAVAAQYAKYAEQNVYWLTLQDGTGAPRRMNVIDGTPNAGAGTDTHEFTVHYEPDQGYWQQAPGPDSLDRWFIAKIALGDEIEHANAGKPVTFDLPLKDMGGNGLGTLKIFMYGGYDTDHEVSVSFEGEQLGTFAWSGYTHYGVTIEDVDFTEKTGDGKHTVSVTCLSGFDKIAFDWLEATYHREFVADNDSLTFSHPAGYRYTMSNFSSDALMVFDITSPNEVIRVEGFDISEIVPSYTLEFETTDSGGERTYLVLADDIVKTTAVAILKDSASKLGDTTKGADYILITHRDLGWDLSGQIRSWIQELVELRRDQGLRVKVVDVQDIYDEFSYGLVTPKGIKDFLTYAYLNWGAPAAQYVVLVGDSSYDFKDNWGLGTINYVPGYLTYTEFMGETVTDEWFVTVSGDDAVPDMYIGRLPAQSAAEAQVMVDKIIAYETTLNTKSWEKNTLLVADDRVKDFEAVFETMNEDAAALLPGDMNRPHKGYLQDYLNAGFAPADLNSDIVDQLNAGTLIVNFSGHGYLQGWTDELIFNTGDINSLTNLGKYPFIVSMSCLTGYFAYPEAWTSSLAEGLLRAAGKGTAAALMPTGMSTTESQHVLNTALFETIFTEDLRKLGPVIAQAKRVLLANGDAYFEQVSETFLLFGDPAMQLKVPLPRRPTGLEATFKSQGGIALRWDAASDCNDNPVAGYNVFRSTSPSGNFTKLNSDIVTQREYIDGPARATAASSSPGAAASGTTYYYTVTSVDTDADESIQSAMVSPSPAGSSSSSSGGGVCFVNAAAKSFKLANIRIPAIYYILIVCGLLWSLLKIVAAKITASRLAHGRTRQSHGKIYGLMSKA